MPPKPAALAAIALLACVTDGEARTRGLYDFHGLLFSCGKYPPVNLTGRGQAYVYKADLTTSTEGTATLSHDAVTVSFRRKFRTFTISRKPDGFYVGKVLCHVDDV